MNIVICPTSKSNTDFNLSLTSKYFELELQDWHFAYIENAEEPVLRFEFEEQPIIDVSKEFIQSDTDTPISFIEFSRRQDLVFNLL